MAKQLNVNLGFTADTSQAKAQIANLQSELSKLMQTPTSLFDGGKTQQEINAAIKGVAELQSHLKAATNMETGSLDFAKLNDSVRKSGTSLQAYGDKLRSLGPAGQNAFNQLANAVAQSEIPIRRSNAMLTQFATTLKNTARWQLSSSMLHGFMGGLQSAVGYAKDLNRSLNDIRIVTGYSVDRMAAFADQANKAAKALSTTTTDYTKASLIYFQQGLNDAEVKERTDITIKMANVSRQSAEVVSDQMTAVWNNFADGTQTLESFADAMVALGAKTASSSDEIAGGLEKFAAIGETIGLSFDYAAAALATITAKTRQSEDVVGTALKTIFARIQGLKLGDTLEDGTDLNKYSEALQKVEIDIKDAEGNLKDMDVILEEMGAKWKTLARDQQVALAQTVAGVRQYNQLVSLMDNWDFMKENLNTVENSAGALDKQAKTYEESWEAASKRVRASMEGIFNELLDDKAFVGILNSFEDILNYIDNVIEGIGGLKGVLMTLGAVLTKVFAQQMAQGLTTMATNIKLMTKSGQQAYQQERSNTIKNFANSLGTTEYSSQEDKTRAAYLKNNLTLQQSFIDNESKMSAMEREVNQTLLDRNRILGENAVNAAKTVDTTTEKRSDAKFKIQTEMAQQTGNDARAFAYENNEFAQTARGLEGIITQQEAVKASMKILGDESLKTSDKISRISKELRASGMSAKEIDKIEKELRESGGEADALIRKLGNLQSRELKKKTEIVYGRGQGNEATMDSYDAMTGRNSEEGVEGGTGISKRTTEEYTNAIRDNIIAKRNAQQANEDLKNSEKGVKQSIEESQGAQKNWANTLVTVSNGVMSLFSALNMLRGIKDVLSNPDMSGWEKFLSVGTTIAMIIPMIVQAIQGLKVAMAADTVATGINTVAKLLNWAASKKSAQASREEALAQKADTASNNENTKSEIANAAAKKVNNGVTKSVGKDGKTRYFQNGKRIKNSVGEELFNKGASGTGGATNGIGGKLKGWGGQVGKSFGNLGKSLLNFGKAYGVTIAGVVAGLMIMNSGFKKINESAEKAKKANEKAQQAQEALTEAQSAYDELASNVDKYTSATKNLEELTQGTAEYKEKLNEANQAALNLIRTQGLMSGEDYEVDSVTGQIVLNDTDAIKSAALDNLLAVQAANMMAQQEASEANLQLQKEEFNRKHVKGSDGFLQTKEDQGTTLGYAGGGMAIGTAIGTVIAGPIGAAIGAGIGGLAGVITGAIVSEYNEDATTEEDKALNILSEAYRDLGNSVLEPGEMQKILSEQGIEQSIIDSLIAAGSDTEEIVAAIAANTDAITAERTAHVVQIMADSAVVNASEIKDEIIEGLGETYDEVYSDETKTVGEENKFEVKEVDDGKGGTKYVLGDYKGSKEDAQKLFADYTQQKGIQGTFKSVKDGFITYVGADDQEYTVAASTIVGNKIAASTDKKIVEKGEAAAKAFSSDETDDDFLVFKNTNGHSSGKLTYNDVKAENDAAHANTDPLVDADHPYVEYVKQHEGENFFKDFKNEDYLNNFNKNMPQSVDWEKVKSDNEYARQIQEQMITAIGSDKYQKLIDNTAVTPTGYYTNENQEVYSGIGGTAGEHGIEYGVPMELIYNNMTRYMEDYDRSLQGTSTEQTDNMLKVFGDAISKVANKSGSDLLTDSTLSTVTLNGLNKLGQLGDTNYTVKGEEKNGLSEFNNMIKGLAPEDSSQQQKLINSLSEVNWDAMGAGDRAFQKLQADDLIPEGEVEKYKERIAEFSKGIETDKIDKIYKYAAVEAEMSAEAFQAYVKQIQKAYPALKDNEAMAIKVAKAMAQQEKKLKTLGEKYADLKDSLADSKKGTAEYISACDDLASGLNDVFGSNVFNADEVADNADTIRKALQGDVAAMTQLQDIAGEQILIDIGLGDQLTQEGSLADQVNDWIGSQEFNDLEIGASLDDSGMTDTLNQMLASGEVTVDEMNKLLSGIGFDPQIDYKELPINEVSSGEHNMNQEVEVAIPDENAEGGVRIEKMTLQSAVDTYGDSDATVRIPYIKGSETIKTSSPKTLAKGAGNGSGGGGGGGGGGSNKPKVVQKKAPIKPKKEKDEIERYHEISKAIEDQERVVDRLSKAKDKAYGANKLKAIDKEIAALQKLNELDSQHLKQIREKLALDRKAAAEEHGITFDEFGRINNYEEIIKQKMEWWRTEQQKIQDRETEYEKEKNYNEEYDADGAIKLQIDQDKEKIDEQYEDFKEAITQYEETFSLFEDTVDKMQDQFDQMAEKAIEKVTYEVEFKVEFEESAIELLDFQIKLLGEDFDAFAEIASITMEKTTHLSKTLQAQSDGVGLLYELYDKGTISLDQFVENMKVSLPDILSSMQDMISLDQEMMEYYSKAFDAAEEKFTEYLDFIDSGISKLDHFQNMLSLIGKEQNYDMLGVVLESQYTSASHRLQASSDWYETTKKEYDALYNRWIAEKNLLGPKELEMLEEKLKVARTKMQEADEQRLSDLEAVGEKAQEILQNNLNMARKKFEENLVGSSLEDYMSELDRLSKKQEEYLTNTNKMYETNKLIRQAQMEMDKTDNNRAKQQYNDYVKYIEQLQETGKLSSYELSVAQAKYELLQAQIALEEAKDAKDQVRLTRDSEGNYGYVYTANEDKVSDAEQAVADAENKLYNIGLDGAQDYQSKKAEILQEAIDTFASIEEQYQTGQIKTEAEFNAKMEEAKQYYYNRLKEYDNLYYMALGVMQEESYGNTIDYELDSRNIFDTFATHVDGYLGDVEQSFTDYDNKVGVVKQEVGDDLEAMRKKTEEVTKETEKLTLEAEKLTDQIDNELLSVREATSIWGAYRDELYKNIEANKTLIEQLRTIQELQGGELADYSSFISDQVAKGKGYDDRLIQEALSKRWLKMLKTEGADNYDYAQMKIDYVQDYADLNGLTFEEAETTLQDDAWYKTLGMLRQYKIERTDWAAKKKEILEKDPKADVSWIDNIIAEKLSYDWAAKIKQYIERNPGLKYSDEYLQEMLAIRKVKIDSMKNEDKKDILSNDDLLAPYIEKGKLIDDRKSVSSAVSAATGGYTGEWGPEGKIAILHEKELILNAQDTKNFLSAVEILREINDMLDQNALVASLGAINLQALSLNSSADQVLQQEVTIHADFPNVTDHNEIELAIDNLINAASQHAYRT